MKKELISWLMQLLIVAALGFVGWELHRVNRTLDRSLDVTVSSAGYSGLEVEIKEPVEIKPDDYSGLPVRVER